MLIVEPGRCQVMQPMTNNNVWQQIHTCKQNKKTHVLDACKLAIDAIVLSLSFLSPPDLGAGAQTSVVDLAGSDWLEPSQSSTTASSDDAGGLHVSQKGCKKTTQQLQNNDEIESKIR